MDDVSLDPLPATERARRSGWGRRIGLVVMNGHGDA